MNTGSSVYDVIVIGAGINGSSAALHLARKGKNTVLIDQFPAIPTRGSTGQSKICRRSHSSFQSFNAIIADSLKQWKSLEQESGVSLLRPHVLNFIVRKGDTEFFNKVYSSITKSKSTHLKSIQEFNEEYGTTYPDDCDKIVIEDVDGGVLLAEKCIITIQNLFKESGGKIIDEFPVGKISVAEDGTVLLNGSSGSLQSKSLVICAGPWTSKLLQPLGVDLPISAVKTACYYWPILEDKTPKDLLFIDGDSSGCFYGLPSTEYPGTIKICFYGGDVCDPDLVDKGPTDNRNSLRDQTSQYIIKHLPWVGGQYVIEDPCMYTNSPDKEMIIDRHPEFRNIVFACGFSGTGFKTGPAVGKILSEMTIGGEQSFDIREFSMSRFQAKERN